MNISDVLSEDMIVSELQVSDKRQLFKNMADFIAQQKNLDQSSVFEAIWERENLGSTGYGDGVAFPHARMSSIDEVIVSFFRLNHEIDYDAIDNKDVDLILCVISPENRGEDHLQTLAFFSRIFKNNKICDKIRKAKSISEIYHAID